MAIELPTMPFVEELNRGTQPLVNSIHDAGSEPPGLGRLLQTYNQPNERGRLTARLPRAVSPIVAISAVGGQVGQLDLLIGSIEDPAERQRVREGLRVVVAGLGTDPASLLDLSLELGRVQGVDEGAFRRVLTAANGAGEANLAVDGFVRAYLDLAGVGGDAGFGDRLAAQVEQIAILEGFPDQRQRTLDNLIEATSAALGLDRQARAEALDELFDELEWEDTLADKAAFLER